MEECLGFVLNRFDYDNKQAFNGDLKIQVGDKVFDLNDKSPSVFFTTREIIPDESHSFKLVIENQNKVSIEPRKCRLEFLSYDLNDCLAWVKENLINRTAKPIFRSFLIENSIEGQTQYIFEEPCCQSIDIKPQDVAKISKWQKPMRNQGDVNEGNIMIFDYSNVHNGITYWASLLAEDVELDLYIE